MAGASVRITADLRRRLVDRILRLGPAWVTGERSGELEAVLVDGVERLDVYFRLFLSKVIVARDLGGRDRRRDLDRRPGRRRAGRGVRGGAGGDPAVRVPRARVAHAVLVRQLPPARCGVRRRAAGDGDPEDVRGGAPAGRGSVPPRPRRARLGDPADERVGRLLGDHGVHRGRRRRGRARGRRVPARRWRDHPGAADVRSCCWPASASCPPARSTRRCTWRCGACRSASARSRCSRPRRP